MATGTPVIASDLPALREVLGEAACYVDPCSEQDLARAIIQLANSPARLARLSKMGMSRSGAYTWRDCAEKTLRVYEEVARSWLPADLHARQPAEAETR